MGDTFFNVQQMSTQLATYIVLLIPLYHASITFKFINTSPLQKCAFVLKDVKSLKTLPSNSTNIMCSSIIDKYIKRHNSLSNISFIEFVIDHEMVNVNKKRHKYNIIHCVHYNEHHGLIFFIKNNNYYLFFFDNGDTLKGHHSTWHSAYNLHEKKISLVRKKFAYCFRNDNTHTMN